MDNKVIDYSVYTRVDNKATKIGNTTSVTLPSIEFMTDSIKGSGIIGEVDLPTYGQIGAMSTELSMRITNEQMGQLLAANELEYRWVNDGVDTSTGKIKTLAHKAFLKVIVKKYDEGKLEPGAAQDGSIEYEVTAYKRIINGKEILNIDKFNGIYAINGVNKYKDLASLL